MGVQRGPSYLAVPGLSDRAVIASVRAVMASVRAVIASVRAVSIDPPGPAWPRASRATAACLLACAVVGYVGGYMRGI